MVLKIDLLLLILTVQRKTGLLEVFFKSPALTPKVYQAFNTFPTLYHFHDNSIILKNIVPESKNGGSWP